ncbi:MAG: iron transporter FeoB [candidate division Zixibacteria bacterium]|nr:iron transporter FeoB [candidate division Zixibacteria bacterium]
MSSDCNSCGFAATGPEYSQSGVPTTRTVALAGNPNVGKTSVFNALTGLRQHTGNWPGKTVLRAQGTYTFDGRDYMVVDLPGTYSLFPRSTEEEVARDFICFGQPDVTVVVADATALERNLNLVLQVAEMTDRVVVALNLVDEARRKGMAIDADKLADELGVPVVSTVARSRRGIEELKEIVDRVATGQVTPSPKPIVYDQDLECQIQDLLPQVSRIVGDKLSPRWVALRLIEGDTDTLNKIEQHLGTTVTTESIPQPAQP